MLRVGLTGCLGAGKSTVARMLAVMGAMVMSSDAIGRELMEPGREIYAPIVARFGGSVVLPGGKLDLTALARLAFEQGQVEALNEIVHPAVIAAQEERMHGLAKDAVVVIESALIFETKYGGAGGWRERFDRMVLVTAPESVKVARFLERSGATEETRGAFEVEAQRRLALQMPDVEKAALSDYVLVNECGMAELHAQVEYVWGELARAAAESS